MYRRILVPTDGSDSAERTIEHVLELAKVWGSSVTFLFVMDTARKYHEGMMTEVRKTLSNEGERILARARQSADEAGVDGGVELLEGDPADVIVRRAEDFDLIAMGSHGKGLWKRLVAGSVSQAVLHRIRRPVLLVPCTDAPSTK